jgi:hypothetical protein
MRMYLKCIGQYFVMTIGVTIILYLKLENNISM